MPELARRTSLPTDVADSFRPSCSTPSMAQQEPSNAKNDRVYYRRGGRYPQTSLPVGGLSEADRPSIRRRKRLPHSARLWRNVPSPNRLRRASDEISLEKFAPTTRNFRKSNCVARNELPARGVPRSLKVTPFARGSCRAIHANSFTMQPARPLRTVP
jgi:hypothetical protein